MIGGTLLFIGLENRFSDDPKFAPKQVAAVVEQNELLRESIDLQCREMEFYGILQEEPAYRAIDIIRPYGEGSIHTVPKAEFGARSGLWMSDEGSILERREQDPH